MASADTMHFRRASIAYLHFWTADGVLVVQIVGRWHLGAWKSRKFDFLCAHYHVLDICPIIIQRHAPRHADGARTFHDTYRRLFSRVA